MTRVLLSDWIRHRGNDGDNCVDCGSRLVGGYVRHWRMTVSRPWTWLLPEVERRYFECSIDHDVEQHIDEVDR